MKSVHSRPPSAVEDATPDSVPTSLMNTHPGDVELLNPLASNSFSQSGEEQDPETQLSSQNAPQTTFQGPRIPAGSTTEPPKQEENPRLLGIPAYQGHSYGDSSYDYMRKYSPDAEGKELDPDSRLWRVYLGESERYDNDMIKGFQNTIDTLLVFAALFSSVVTGFVTQTSEALKPDYARIGASLLFEQIQVLRAAGNETRIKEIPRSPLNPDSAAHSGLDVAVNWLLFTSLALALATAFVSVLIKQWLLAFTALVPGDAKRRSLTRQFRFTGLQKWKLPEIINILPLFLHFSLAFFLIGLCLFVLHFHSSILDMLILVTFAAFAFFIITAALPAVHLDCPYRLPILYIPLCLVLYCIRLLRFEISKRIPNAPAHSRPSLLLFSLYSQEQRHVSQVLEQLEASSLTWLFNQSTNTSVQRITLHGVNRFLRNLRDELGDWWRIRRGVPGALRDSLPLESMSMAAIRFLSPGAQLEDAHLLREVIISSRKAYDSPLLQASAWDLAINSPYCRDFVEADVLPMCTSLKVFYNGSTGNPVQFACSHNKWDIAIYLLERFPALAVADQSNSAVPFWPLGYASQSSTISHKDWVTIFSLTNAPDVDFNTPHVSLNRQGVLHSVCQRDTVAALQHLISHVPDLNFNITDDKGLTPLHCACFCNTRQDMDTRLSMVRLLLAQGADIRQKDTNGLTSLHHICCSFTSVFLVIQELILAGADPNALDNSNKLPLHYACMYALKGFGCTEEGLQVVKELVMSTTNVNQLSTSGETPLDVLERSDLEEWAAGYSLLRNHGALLAKELPQATSIPPAALNTSRDE